MKNILVFILLQFLIPYNILIQAQWIQTNGPGVGYIYQLAANDNYVFAYSSTGVYRSTNYGLNWAKNNLYSFNIILFKGSNTYAAANNGIYLSSDGGTNWDKSNFGLIDTNITSMVISEDNIFAGTSKSGVYLSTNNGLNWTKAGLDTIGITSLVSRNNYVFASSAYGVYVSSDAGKNWTQMNNGLFNSSIMSLAINETKIFAFAASTIYSSTDNGENWTISLSNSLMCLAANGSNIYAGKGGGGFDNGMFRSTDNGLTWVQLGAPGKVEVMAFSGTKIYAGIHNTWYMGYSNLVESENNGDTWTKIGLPLSAVHALFINGTDLYAGYSDIDISTDFGNHWARINPWGDTFLRIYSMYMNDKYTLVCAEDENRTRIWLDNDTIDWQPVNNNGLDIDMIASSFAYLNSNVYMGISMQGIHGPTAGVYVSTDNGLNWKQTGLANVPVNCLVVNGSEILAGTTRGVYFSTNNGINWTKVNNGLTDTVITAITVCGSDLFAGTSTGGVYYSNDNGLDWKKVNNGLNNTNIRCFAVSGTNIFAGTGGGVYLSSNNGSAWTLVGSDTIDVLSLAVTDSLVFVGSNGYGVLKRSLNDLILPVELISFAASSFTNNIKLNWSTATEANTSSFEIEKKTSNGNSWQNIASIKASWNSTTPRQYSYIDKNIHSGKYSYRLKMIDLDGSFKYSEIVKIEIAPPANFELSNAYPNPWNPTTTIRYQVPANILVTIKVFDALGREVSTLVNEIKSAGSYEVTFNAKGLSSGTYYYQMKAGTFIETKKITLLK